MRIWAKQLAFEPGSDDWFRLIECAAVNTGYIPDYIPKDIKLAAHMPAFFRTFSG